MAQVTALPHPALKDLVAAYWGVARDFSHVGGIDLTPDCFAELIFTRSRFIARFGRESIVLSSCFLVGVSGIALRLEADRMVRCAAVRMKPGAAKSIFGAADNDPVKDLGNLIGEREVAAITAAVEAGQWEAGVALLDRLLLARLASACAETTAAEFSHPQATSALVVAKRMCLSRRQVERRFRSATGWSPKQLSSLARFQRVRDALWREPSQSLARLAIDAGYADQAHMSRQFKRFSGMTIGRFLSDMRERRDWLKFDDVAFVQSEASAGQ